MTRPSERAWAAMEISENVIFSIDAALGIFEMLSTEAQVFCSSIDVFSASVEREVTILSSLFTKTERFDFKNGDGDRVNCCVCRVLIEESSISFSASVSSVQTTMKESFREWIAVNLTCRQVLTTVAKANFEESFIAPFTGLIFTRFDSIVKRM